MKRAVFLDRDGVISKNTWRENQWRAPINFEEFCILPDVVDSIDKLKEMGFFCIVITNQPEVGSGEILQTELDKMNDHLLGSTKIDDIYVCDHVKNLNCDCRKPKPGLIIRAADKWEIDINRSFMIGDRFSDVKAAKAAGCLPILVISEATSKDKADLEIKTFVAISLSNAVNLIKYLEKEEWHEAFCRHC